MNRAKSVELDIDTIAASAEFSPMMTHSELNQYFFIKKSANPQIYSIFLANSVTVTTPPPPSIELPKPNPNDEDPDDNESMISKGQSKSTAIFFKNKCSALIIFAHLFPICEFVLDQKFHKNA